jgi:putative MATE family efflux protein
MAGDESAVGDGDGRSESAGAVGPGRILRIAIPTLGVLVAEPVYLLFDMAVVGRLGALALAGLAVGGLILGLVSTQLTFLSYGTTARAARRHGAGDTRGAVQEGVQASWLAIGIGLAIVVVLQIFAAPVTHAVAGGADIAGQAQRWVRIAVLGVPFILLANAGNGWMRGVQQTRRPLVYVIGGFALSGVLCPILVHGLLGAPRLELAGSAVANLAGQATSGGLFLSTLVRQCLSSSGTDRVPLAPLPAVMREQLRLGRDLIMRSFAFQACFVSAGAVASRFGAASVAAHQLVLQLWNFLSLTLDSLAIAAQTLVGGALGAGDAAGARRVTRRITVWSTLFALGLAVVFAVGSGVMPRLFTTDPQVIGRVHVIWWFFVSLIPIAGVVFALDGTLLGAGDAAYLRTTTMAAGLLGFLPMIWLSLVCHWGIAGIWAGLTAFILGRLLAVGARTRSGHWARVGAELPG